MKNRVWEQIIHTEIESAIQKALNGEEVILNIENREYLIGSDGVLYINNNGCWEMATLALGTIINEFPPEVVEILSKLSDNQDTNLDNSYFE